MIQVICQMNELEILLLLTIQYCYNKTEEKRVDRSSQEILDQTTFRIVLLDIQRKI